MKPTFYVEFYDWNISRGEPLKFSLEDISIKICRGNSALGITAYKKRWREIVKFYKLFVFCRYQRKKMSLAQKKDSAKQKKDAFRRKLEAENDE